MAAVRILIADDQELIRLGVRAFLSLQNNLRVVGEVSKAPQIVETANRTKPDVIILEPVMAEFDGIEAIRELRSIPTLPRIVILTSYESAIRARKALEAGAMAYVLKSDPGNELKMAIEAVLRGQRYLSSAVTDTSANRPAGGPAIPKTLQPLLTTREMEILRLLSLGKSSKQIADGLEVGVRTIETHRANMMRKLGLHSVTEMLHYAFKNNVFNLPMDS
ncbi:MAG: response regulator transcription factor [Candidatus Acidiferrum sp.]